MTQFHSVDFKTKHQMLGTLMLVGTKAIRPHGVTASAQSPLQISLLHWYNANLVAIFKVGVFPSKKTCMPPRTDQQAWGFFFRSLVITGTALLATVAAGVTAAASKRSDTQTCLDNATKVLQQIAPDQPNGVPKEVTEAAVCVAVVPHLLKGRFGSTAPQGKGVVTCCNAEGWSAPAFFTLSDGFWLSRARIRDTSLILIIMSKQARQLFSTRKIEIGTDVSAISGPVGRHVSHENYYRLTREMLTYSISKGHFAPLSLDGAMIREDRRSIAAIYGRAAVMQAVLSGRFPVPPAARSFLALVNAIVESR